MYSINGKHRRSSQMYKWKVLLKMFWWASKYHPPVAEAHIPCCNITNTCPAIVIFSLKVWKYHYFFQTDYRQLKQQNYSKQQELAIFNSDVIGRKSGSWCHVTTGRTQKNSLATFKCYNFLIKLIYKILRLIRQIMAYIWLILLTYNS